MPNTAPFTDLNAAAAWYRRWLTEHALPLWAQAGVDPSCGGFVECLSVEGEPLTHARRARVQARQTWVYASVALRGLEGPWLKVARDGFDWYLAHYRRRSDGLFLMLADCDGTVLDASVYVYEQAFSLLALSGLHAAGETDARDLATGMFAALAPYRHPAGGFREAGANPFQANCHMHMLEACLAWEDAGVDDWRAVADDIAELCLTRFLDADGVLHEFFDEDWTRLDEGGLIEPGHQFEWAWLLDRWGRERGDARATAAAQRLYANGLKGVDPVRGVAVNALWDDFRVRDGSARLWPQTEYVKAALIFGDETQALSAVQAMASYLQTPKAGAWRDKLQPDGSFLDEPAPATSLYHLYGAIAPLLDRA